MQFVRSFGISYAYSKNKVFSETEEAIYQDLTVIITGGDAFLFDLNIKNKIFAQQNLQAIGLNRILLYNAE